MEKPESLADSSLRKWTLLENAGYIITCLISKRLIVKYAAFLIRVREIYQDVPIIATHSIQGQETSNKKFCEIKMIINNFWKYILLSIRGPS